MKRCARCLKRYSLAKFGKNIYMADKKDHYCKECRTIAGVASHNTHKKNKRCKIDGCVEPFYAKDYCKIHYTRNWRNNDSRETAGIPTFLKRPDRLMSQYGLTPHQYKAMSKNGCNICGDMGSVWTLNVDHDHACCSGNKSCGNCVRGILCTRCNTTLSYYDRGKIRDNHPLIGKIEKYLKRYENRKKKVG